MEQAIRWEEVPGLDITVEQRVGMEAVSGCVSEWDGLARAMPEAGPFALSGWTRLWMESFAPGSTLRVFRASRGGRAIAMAPLLERRGRLAGVPVRLWQSPSNEHSQRVAWALDAACPREAVRGVWERLREEPWEVLLLKDIEAGGAVDATLGEAAGEDGFLVARWPSLESPWLPVVSRDALEQTLDARFRANLRRRRKKLAKHGTLELERVEGGDALTRALEEGLGLEGGGWKGRSGTAIVCHPETLAFYGRLARFAAEEGCLSLYTLKVGGRPVAFHFGLEYGGRYYLLKPGYDEGFSECSPGQLLVEDVLEDLAHRGTAEFDFLGPKMTWKLDWTERLRSHVWLFILRPSLKGRLLYAARFRQGPAVKHWLEEVGGWKR
ncbi:GNAT family N-acetyltransferase [Vitiosangium sp. GDMCC 1.1324]|uniref:GNAT family N-acetyltransferase n=1 Tax=Vitiosangium sp. (strain GDMCC 1.1324) TaxID=2138576 RepID=UPI000D34C610|nr:GNAT family N-acetyltransferase [Vitiosangium sp. GDMCC 1.1324]PTL77802.1 cellulose biosynthesis (CelD)-like protein [Vitiosangium sp. GDMCC 1.1324]